MRRGKWTAIAAMAAAVAMVTAACGSSGDEEPAADTGSSQSQEAPAEDTSEAPAEDTPSEAPAEDTPSEAPADDTPSEAPSGAAFQFGYVLPQTGDLAFLGPPQITAAKYAISLINEAGGINGQQVPDAIAGDEANDAALAADAATKELNDGVNAILGAAATGMTMAIIDKVTGAQVAQCSGSNTGVLLTDYANKKGPDGQQYYFRTAPSDALQGPVLGNLVLSEGNNSVAIVYRNDDYGKGLAQATADAIKGGGGDVVLNDGYDIKTPDFSSLVDKIKASNPDAIVTVSFDEGWQLWKSLVQSGISPDALYGADGMRSTEAPAKTFTDPTEIDGAGGTAPASVDNPDFVEALQAFNPDLKETQFAPQIFDCTNIFALAAEQAKSNDAADWVQYVIDVTKDGTECTTYADCKDLVDSGEDIHYVGASGDLSYTDAGEPGKASIEIYKYDNGGELESVDTQQASI